MDTLNDQIIARLQDSVFELKVKCGVLEKQYELALKANAEAHVAKATSEKALQMAQEALTLMMGQQSQVAPPTDIVDPLADMILSQESPKSPSSTTGNGIRKTDMELSQEWDIEGDYIEEQNKRISESIEEAKKKLKEEANVTS